MASETVRIKPETHAKLRAICETTGKSMPEVLEDAIESLRQTRLLDETNHAFAALRDDPQAWQAELDERKSWEATLGDDLEDK
jgi:predicted transcriptional regulator